VVLAAIAFAIAAAYEYTRPVQYKAQSTVFVTRVLPSDPTTVDSAVDDFQTAIGLAQVRRSVGAQVGVRSGSLGPLPTLSRLGSSSAVQVSYQSSDAARSSHVVTTASRTALMTLAEEQLDGAREAVSAAQPAADGALRAVVSYEQGLGVTDLNGEYQTRQQALLDLENQLANATPAQVPTLNARIVGETAAVNRLGAALPEYQQLLNRLTQARTTLDTASNALVDAQARVAGASAPTTVTTPSVTKMSRVLPVVRAGVIAALIVLVLGCGLYALVDNVSRPRPLAPDDAVPAVPSATVAPAEETGAERTAPV
jgi:hypothetical protein